MNLSAFSETLSRLRRERGLTQAELGARLGISKSAVSMYECGNREPELDLLRAMADLFGVSESRPELRMLFSLTKNATKQDVEAAVRIIEALRAPDADT